LHKKDKAEWYFAIFVGRYNEKVLKTLDRRHLVVSINKRKKLIYIDFESDKLKTTKGTGKDMPVPLL